MNYELMAKQTPIKKGVEKLQAELTQAWKDIESLPVIELAARNPAVMEYTKHWEGRAITAERRIAELEAALDAALAAFETYFNQYPHMQKGYTLDAIEILKEVRRGE